MRPFMIVIAGHGDFPVALLSSARLIVGEIDDCHAVSLDAGGSVEDYQDRLSLAIGSRPALVLCDLAGGTPANCALRIKGGSTTPTTIITGVNLGMIAEVALWNGPLDEALVERLVSVGREGIGAPTLAGHASDLDIRGEMAHND